MDWNLKPRLESSVKWTPLPQELNEQIREIFEENFQDSFAESSFIVQSHIYAQEILLRVGHLENGTIRQRNFEASIEYDEKKENIKDCIYVAVDMIGSLMADYLQTRTSEEDFNFSQQWQEHKADDRILYLKTSTINTELESEADLLLGDFATEGLVTESVEGTDALDHSFIDPELS